jgi:hypothetical protein
MAAASLGRLTLDLVAKVGNFIEPMTKAERQAKNSSKGIASSFNTAALAATALTAAVAGISVGGMITFADQTIQAGSEIKKFSQLANTSVRDFQYYAKGAETAGISMESFADKMKDMQDRIGDFQQTGGGPLADFFTNIAPLVGVTIQQFQKLSGPQALQLYYDSLKKVGVTQNDMKFYLEAIISDSSLLLPLLENGGAGFKKWGDAAERANAILSDDMVQSLALAKENVQLLNLQWEGLQATFVNAVVPVIQTVSDNMGTIKAVAVAVAAAMAVKLVPTVVLASIQLAQLAAFSVRAGVGLVGLSGSMGALSGAMAFLGGPAGLAMLALQGLAAGAAFLYMKKSSDSLDPSLSTQGKSIADLTAEYEKLDATQKRVLTRKATDELNEANQAYREQKNEMLGLIDAVTRNSQVSEKDRGIASQLFEQYRLGKINSNDLATAVNNLATVSDSAKSSIDKKAEAVSKESSAVNNAKSILDAYNGKVKQNTKNNQDNARSITDQANALSNLTQKQREALKDIQSQISKANYIDANMAAGWSRDKAEYFADYRQNAGLSFTGASLSESEKKQVEAGYKLEQQTKAREESEKKIEELNRKKLELSQKQYSYTKAELQMLQKVAELNAKHNLNEIGAKYGVPDNLLAAVMAQESKGDINAKSQTGAIGPFQTTSIFRKQYGLSVNDSYNVPKVADAIARDISKSFEVFGNWHDAITAVNAGAQGTKNLLVKGFTGSAAKTKEAKGYAPLVDKWLMGLAGTGEKGSSILSSEKTDAVKAWGDYWSEIETLKAESLEKQKSVSQTYFTEEEQMAEDNKDKLRLINEAFAGDKTAIEKYTKLQQIAYQQDVENYRRAQQEKFDSSKNDLLGQLADARDAITLSGIASKYGQNSPQYQNANLSITSSQAKSAEDARYANSLNQIGNEYGAPDEVKKRYELIELAKKLHLENMKALDAEYLARAKQMSLDQYQQQLDMWQSLLANGQNTFSQLTQAVQSSAGEQSSAYQIMFAGQQAFSVASSMVAAWTAYTQAFADPSAMTLPQKFAGAAAVMAALAPALASITSIAIEGFATGGHITGAGTGTSDDIPIWASNGEFMIRTAAVEKLGLANLNYMNATGEIPNKYATGGAIALDPPKVLNTQSEKMNGYREQAQQARSQPIENKVNVAIFDDRQSMKDAMFGPDGEKAHLYHYKRNQSKLGAR